MKAMYLVRVGDAAQAFEMREAPMPTPGAGQVRVAVEAFGLNYADVMARLGLLRFGRLYPSIMVNKCINKFYI
jgi:NADPH2:quinone reductase